ncbi:60s ribosomal protein l7 [Moniliophthora roreri MCA 2997]|uniref:60s ribosomal protein l7 n=2 Tax=Moniliophthora roreri TaxID=221103 RepID=V2XPJ6_MONRO|nr:60s ribosomal protein l7 [Moniliophthora roreri MCA 2997]KAI3621271.1 60s ribosomal protein l7 [Moniliophthora roreri]
MSTQSWKARSLVRFGRAPPPPKPLKINHRTKLPQPHVKILTREFAPSRLQDHYYTTLQDDVMYMTYKHELGPRPPPRNIRLRYDPEDPYSKYRYNPPVGGDHQIGRKPPPPSTPENVTRLEAIQIHTMAKDAINNRSNLLSVIMALRALSGETFQGGGHHAVEGVQITRGKKTVSGWVRKNLPIGAKVTMKGQSMYDFIGTLVEFVLPRLRDFQGVQLPPASANTKIPSAVAGVVSFGLGPEAMGYFPQIEVNMDAYPKLYGMHIHFITNATGVGAQDRARALVSGFQIPFARSE